MNNSTPLNTAKLAKFAILLMAWALDRIGKFHPMLRNYFLLFFRNLKRQKLFSVINLLGLTVSIVATMLIYVYVRQEFSFDRFHNDAENIYRVNQTFIWGENSNNEFASTGPGVAT